MIISQRSQFDGHEFTTTLKVEVDEHYQTWVDSNARPLGLYRGGFEYREDGSKRIIVSEMDTVHKFHVVGHSIPVREGQ